jgi:glycosyltransferase involved in cell wall biosynthesis
VTPARILNVVPTLMCGGTENQFMTLSRLLDPARFDVEFACLRRWGPFVQEILDRGIPLTEYKISTFRSVGALRQQARLIGHINRQHISIVHAYNFYGNVFAIPPARLAAPVVIASIRDCAPYLTPMQKRVQRYACQFADRILVNAEAVRSWLLDEGFDESKITVIRNGVELSRFSTVPDPAKLRHDLGLPLDTPLVAVVSRLTELKGLENFIEAAAMVAPTHPAARFLIVGETNPAHCDYLEVLKGLTRQRGIEDRVIFTGLRSDVPALLSSVSVSVMPSLNEALSNVLLESMAAGAPTVATRVGGTPEALIDGETGLLVPPGDAREIATAVSRLLDDQAFARALGRSARQLIEDRFSVERMVRSTEDVYAELLARKTRRKPVAA